MYTDADKIASYMQRTLDNEQTALANQAAQSASSWIETYTHRKWDYLTPVTESIIMNGSDVHLTVKPVDAITSVTLNRYGVATALNATQWVLVDKATGLLRILIDWEYAIYDSIDVVYSHTGNTPEHVILAATILAAHLLQPSLNPIQQRVSDLTDSSGARYKFIVGDVPVQVYDLLRGSKKAFIV